MNKNRMIRAALAAVLTACICSTSWAATEVAAASVERFEIRSQSLSDALRVYADQTGEQIVFFSEIGKGLKSSAVMGSFTREQALERLLKQTGLTYERLNTKTIAITDMARNAAKPIAGLSAGQGTAMTPVRVARSNGPEDTDTTPAQDEQTPQTPVAGKAEKTGSTEVVVTGSRLPRSEIESASPVLKFDREYIERSGFSTLEEFMRILPQNFSASGSGRQTVPNDENPVLIARQPGQSGLGLRGLGSNNTLVLINGRRAPLSGIGNRGTPTQQSFFDINTIPLGLIERIEIITDGASAVYGTDAIAGVVNIILKEEYNSTEIRTRFGGTQHGGAFERGATLTHGFSVGRLQTTTTLDGFQRQPLQGNQRPFSDSTDHTDQGGSDFRTNIGYPNTISARAGQFLPGVFNADGSPARQAVVPANQDGTALTAADFAATASGISLYDSADLYSLITPTERFGASTRLNFSASDRLNVYGEVAYTYTDSSALANPLISSNISGNSSVTPFIPASNPYNPFGIDLGFRMTHLELGPRDLVAETKSLRSLAGLQFDLGGDWSVEASAMYYLQDFFTSAPSVDNDALRAALNQTDPALALNLFGDFSTVGSTNSPGVYENIIGQSITEADSKIYSGDLLLRGPVWQLPAGLVRTAFGAEWSRQDRLRTTNAPSSVSPERSEEKRDDYAVFGELQIPLFSREHARPFLQRLELQLAGRWQDTGNAGDSFNPKYGLVWSPFKSLMFRGTFGTGYRAPALSELERPESQRTQTITDSTRVAPDNRYPVNVIVGSFPNLKPETSKTYGYGVVIQVPWIEGLSFSFDGYRKDQKNLTASLITQTMVDYEELFPGRIIRDEPSAEDMAAGRPGLIVEVDGRFSNFGRAVTEGWDGTVTYDLPTTSLGRFTFRVTGTLLGSYKVAFNPGDPLEERGGTFGFPQKVKGNASMFWNRERWGGAVFVYYQGAAERSSSDRVSAFTTTDMNLSFEWSENLRLQGGIGNIFDREPPFANTTWGYDGGFHSAKMRTYNATAIYRF